MRRYSEPIGDNAIGDEFQKVWDEFKKIKQGVHEIITGPGTDLPNLIIQQADPGPAAFPYVWLELNPDNTIKRVWKWTP